MSNINTKEIVTHWYREPWAWFIVAILLGSIVWVSYKVYFALKIQDSLVVGDYYKKGKIINQDLTRKKNAQTLKMKALIDIDNQVGEIKVTMQGLVKEWPSQLKLSFLSHVFSDQDEILLINRSIVKSSEVIYIGQLSHQLEGKFYIQLETMNTRDPESPYEKGWVLMKDYKLSYGDYIIELS